MYVLRRRPRIGVLVSHGMQESRTLFCEILTCYVMIYLQFLSYCVIHEYLIKASESSCARLARSMSTAPREISLRVLPTYNRSLAGQTYSCSYSCQLTLWTLALQLQASALPRRPEQPLQSTQHRFGFLYQRSCRTFSETSSRSQYIDLLFCCKRRFPL
jgi:hypothetical protein